MSTTSEGRSAAPRPCPVCSDAMIVKRVEGVRADVCNDHGIWLDRGELDSIVERIGNQTTSIGARTAELDERRGWLFGEEGGILSDWFD